MLITKQVLEDAQKLDRHVWITLPVGKRIWGKVEKITPPEAIGIKRYSGGAVFINGRDDCFVETTCIDIDSIIMVEVNCRHEG